MTNPTQFTYWVGQNKKMNTRKIHEELTQATKKWDEHQYEAFGEDLGEIFYQEFVGVQIVPPK